MVIQPKIRGFICTTAHPEGCAANVRDQINKAKLIESGVTQNTLVLGASTGYGLASLIVAAFSCHAKTIGVSFDRPAVPEKQRTASAGWYNLAAFAKEAQEAGLEHHSVICDAFSKEGKQAVVDVIKSTVGKIDTVVYSLAAPSRTDEKTGKRYQSVIKPIGEAYHTKSLNMNNWELEEVTIEPATEDEIEATIKVMGGEDWKEWMELLEAEGVLEENYLSIAYDYVGPTITHPIYKDGTIGRAKENLLRASQEISEEGGRAFLSVNKAVVTQASAAIPAVPLYIALLFRTMKEKGKHEGCIEQIIRMFEKIGAGQLGLDELGRIRMDDWEMESDIQTEVMEHWNEVNDGNLTAWADIEGFRSDFAALFGFGRSDINYDADVDPAVEIAGSTIALG